MATKASATITLSCYRDTQSVTRYYKLQSSTELVPSKPTTNPPSGWTDTEPTYTSSSTNTLYFCDLTIFSDGTWSYSSVSKSSAYEAAKEAYNKASNAENSANNALNSTDEIRQEIVDQNTAIISTCDEIIMSALESYVKTSDYGEFKETVESELTLLSNELTVNFTTAIEQIESVNSDLQDKFNTVTTFFTFDINGLTIGKTDSPYKIVIDNDRFSMLVNDVEVLWIDIETREVHTPELTITNRFRMFGYQVEEDTSGNLDWEFIGGA